jgi:hypothetical protein
MGFAKARAPAPPGESSSSALAEVLDNMAADAAHIASKSLRRLIFIASKPQSLRSSDISFHTIR